MDYCRDIILTQELDITTASFLNINYGQWILGCVRMRGDIFSRWQLPRTIEKCVVIFKKVSGRKGGIWHFERLILSRSYLYLGGCDNHVPLRKHVVISKTLMKGTGVEGPYLVHLRLIMAQL